MDNRAAKTMAEMLVKIVYEQNEKRPKHGFYTCDFLAKIDKDIQKVLNDISRVLGACMTDKADSAAILAARRLDKEYFPKDLRVQSFLRNNVKCPTIVSNPGG